jgi:hypothetical protein
MLQQMRRIQVIGPKPAFNQVVDLLYREGTLHLEDVSRTVSPLEIPLDKVVLESAGNVALALGKINGIFSALPSTADDPSRQAGIRKTLRSRSHEDVLARAEEIILMLETTTGDLASKKSELTLTAATLNRYAKILDILQPLERELPQLEGFEVTILLILKEHRDVVELIKKELDIITKNEFGMTTSSVDADTLAAIMVFNKRDSEKVHAFIYSANVNEVRLSPEYLGKPFFEMYALIEEQKLHSADEIKRIDGELLALAAQWYPELVVLKKELGDMNDELGAFSNFAFSEYTFVIMGWIPRKKLQLARKTLSNAFADRVVVKELDTTEKDMDGAPVFFDNPRWVQPFEVIMQLVAPPLFRHHGGGYRVRDHHTAHRAAHQETVWKHCLCPERCRDPYPVIDPDHHLWLVFRGVLRGFRRDDGLAAAGHPVRYHVEPGGRDDPDADGGDRYRGAACLLRACYGDAQCDHPEEQETPVGEGGDAADADGDHSAHDDACGGCAVNRNLSHGRADGGCAAADPVRGGHLRDD